jgi:DNA-binding ferritin-like protein
MPKTQTRKNRKSSSTISPIKSFRRSSRSSSSSSLSEFQKEIASVFLEMLLMVKLFHWKTTSYATHKATDELYLKLNANIDSFIEILLGKSGSRIDLMSKSNIRLVDLSSQESLKREVDAFKGYLVGLNDNKALQTMSNSDLFNIRDTILGDLNQFLYLLTFK